MPEAMKVSSEMQAAIDAAVSAALTQERANHITEPSAIQNDVAQFKLDKPHFNGVELLPEGTVATLPEKQDPLPDWIPLNPRAQEMTAKVRARAAAISRMEMKNAVNLHANTLSPEMAQLVDDSLEESLAHVRAAKPDPARDPAFDRRPLQTSEATPTSGPIPVPAPNTATPPRSIRRPRPSDAEI